MKIIFLVLKTFVLSILFLTNSTAEPLVGHFNIVTARYASDVATTLPGFGEQDSPIGQTITFHTNGLTMEGLACEQWQIIKSDTPSINLNDPILADLTINPTDSHLSSGEHRLLKNYSYLCEGEAFIQAFQIDAVNNHSDAIYLLKKSLDENGIEFFLSKSYLNDFEKLKVYLYLAWQYQKERRNVNNQIPSYLLNECQDKINMFFIDMMINI